MIRVRVLPILFLFATGCATAVAPVDMQQPRRVVGTEGAIRVDAEIRGDELRSGQPLPITYEITNRRNAAIAVADIVPVTTYDADANVVTVNIGSEVPGEQLLPRLIEIAPGEKKTFTTAARVSGIVTRPAAVGAQRPTTFELRLKVNFLGDTTGFEDLIAMTEKATADAKRADEVFAVWLERNEAVYTNALPMRWLGRTPDVTTPGANPEAMPTSRRRRG